MNISGTTKESRAEPLEFPHIGCKMMHLT
jgi:hypothetical protein